MSGRAVARSPLAWLGGLITLYLALPLAAFFVRFATAPQRGFHRPGLFSALGVSISCATISLALITVFGVPLAYLLARSSSRVASIVGLIVQIPLALPPLMSGIVLIYVIGPYTFLGRLFNRQLTNSRVGVVIAMTFVAAPFLIVAARAAFSTVDQGLLDVAETLGHGDVSRFLRVAVPMAGPGIRAGMLLSWLRAFGEYGAVVVLAYNPASLPLYTYNQFSGAGLASTLAPTALAIGVAALAVLASRVNVTGRRRATPARPTPVTPERTPSSSVRFDVDQRLGSFHLRLSLDTPVHHLAVLGPSGSGKTALLRTLAGLYGPRAGRFWCDDEPLGDVAVARRRVGYVAQGFALFPHLTVGQQLLFAKRSTPEVSAYWLHHLGLEGLESRYPSQLSGGQRQRVALAQVLCNAPHVLLIDEPFSALDVPVRHELRRLLRRLQREIGLATVLVTHDPEEAAFLAEEIVVISDGRALQCGPSRQVFSRPASLEVARLLGIPNLLSATVVADGVIDAHGVRIAVPTDGLPRGTAVAWSVRPESVDVRPRVGPRAPVDERGSAVPGTVLDVADVGTSVDLFVTLSPELELQARSSGHSSLRVGDRCAVVISADAVSLWPVDVDDRVRPDRDPADH